MDRLSVMKKLNKPLIERRRRERINHHIEELNRLIVQPLLRHRRSIRKLEKADILEITVEYLKLCARNRLPVTMPPSPTSSDGSPPSSQSGGTDLISQQVSQLDGLATLHHLLIENGEGGDMAPMASAPSQPPSQNINQSQASFMPFAQAAVAAACAQKQQQQQQTPYAQPDLPFVRQPVSTTPPDNLLNHSAVSSSFSGDDENDDVNEPPAKRLTLDKSRGAESTASIDSAKNDLLMVVPTTPTSSSASNDANAATLALAAAAVAGSMWRPW